LKLELAALMLVTGRSLTTLEYKETLKQTFDQDYTSQEINEALAEVLELTYKINEHPIDKPEDVLAFPDQFIEGV
jgi:transposase